MKKNTTTLKPTPKSPAKKAATTKNPVPISSSSKTKEKARVSISSHLGLKPQEVLSLPKKRTLLSAGVPQREKQFNHVSKRVGNHIIQSILHSRLTNSVVEKPLVAGDPRIPLLSRYHRSGLTQSRLSRMPKGKIIPLMHDDGGDGTGEPEWGQRSLRDDPPDGDGYDWPSSWEDSEELDWIADNPSYRQIFYSVEEGLLHNPYSPFAETKAWANYARSQFHNVSSKTLDFFLGNIGYSSVDDLLGNSKFKGAEQVLSEGLARGLDRKSLVQSFLKTVYNFPASAGAPPLYNGEVHSTAARVGSMVNYEDQPRHYNHIHREKDRESLEGCCPLFTLNSYANGAFFGRQLNGSSNLIGSYQYSQMLNPDFLGDIFAKRAANWTQFRFEEVVFQYVPMVGTSTSSGGSMPMIAFSPSAEAWSDSGDGGGSSTGGSSVTMQYAEELPLLEALTVWEPRTIRLPVDRAWKYCSGSENDSFSLTEEREESSGTLFLVSSTTTNTAASSYGTVWIRYKMDFRSEFIKSSIAATVDLYRLFGNDPVESVISYLHLNPDIFCDLLDKSGYEDPTDPDDDITNVISRLKGRLKIRQRFVHPTVTLMLSMLRKKRLLGKL